MPLLQMHNLTIPRIKGKIFARKTKKSLAAAETGWPS